MKYQSLTDPIIITEICFICQCVSYLVRRFLILQPETGWYMILLLQTPLRVSASKHRLRAFLAHTHCFILVVSNNLYHDLLTCSMGSKVFCVRFLFSFRTNTLGVHVIITLFFLILFPMRGD